MAPEFVSVPPCAGRPVNLLDRSFSERLFEVYRRLRRHFGYAKRWWPGTPLDIVLTAILVQQSNWSAAWTALGRLQQESLLSLSELAAADPEVVRRCIHGVAFAPTKAGRLVQLARTLCDRGFETIESYVAGHSSVRALRSDLLACNGIGPETADCIVLFTSRDASFVIDNYTRRIFRRLGLFPELGTDFWRQPYQRLQEFFETRLLADLSLYDNYSWTERVDRATALFRDFHAQLVELGCHHCLNTNPRCTGRGRRGWRNYGFCRVHCGSNGCTGCPLVGICATGRHALR